MEATATTDVREYLLPLLPVNGIFTFIPQNGKLKDYASDMIVVRVNMDADVANNAVQRLVSEGFMKNEPDADQDDLLFWSLTEKGIALKSAGCFADYFASIEERKESKLLSAKGYNGRLFMVQFGLLVMLLVLAALYLFDLNHRLELLLPLESPAPVTICTWVNTMILVVWALRLNYEKTENQLF